MTLLFFALPSVGRTRLWVFAIFGLCLIYLADIYSYYFLGGWQKRFGDAPFNEGLLLTIVVLGTIATSAGATARLLHLWMKATGVGRGHRVAIYPLLLLAPVILGGVAWQFLPMSFDMPVNLSEE